ncbi:hypothetical protein [Paenibacillus marinisediminis]
MSKSYYSSRRFKEQEEKEKVYQSNASPNSTKDETFSNSPALAALQQLKQPQRSQEEAADVDAMNSELEPQQVKEEEDRTLPPRRALFPSNYGKLTKWFYNILFLLFFGLLVFLLFWGNHVMTTEG